MDLLQLALALSLVLAQLAAAANDTVVCRLVSASELDVCSKYVTYAIPSDLDVNATLTDVKQFNFYKDGTDGIFRCPFLFNSQFQCLIRFPTCVNKT